MSDVKGFLSSLLEASDDLQWLNERGFLIEIGTGREDACGGYGWHDVFTISIKAVGERCMNCDYDETLPYKELDKIERTEQEKVILGGKMPHRHRYAHAERTIGFWSSFRNKETDSIQEFIRKTKDYISAEYIRPCRK